MCEVLRRMSKRIFKVVPRTQETTHAGKMVEERYPSTFLIEIYQHLGNQPMNTAILKVTMKISQITKNRNFI